MLKIRLRRMGNRNNPVYRVVLSDSRRVPRSSAIEELGHVHPSGTSKGTVLDVERIHHWVARGAQMTPTVRRLVRSHEAAPKPGAEPVAEAEAPVEETAAAEPVETAEAAVEPAAEPAAAETEEDSEAETEEKAEAKTEA